MNSELLSLLNQDYQYGFETELAQDRLPPGLNTEVIQTISAKKSEPEWMLAFRLKAYREFLKMKQPNWAELQLPELNLQKISFFSQPKLGFYSENKSKINFPQKDQNLPSEILKTFSKLGISLEEGNRLSGVAVDAVFDSTSVKTTFQKELASKGIIFCSFSEAVQKYPELVKKYLSKIVPIKDNYFSALNSAVFSDGSFVYIPPNTRCPMELSTYFRINARQTGQFERTLIIADKNSYVSYLEGCTAPMFDENQLHAAVVELVALEQSEIKYSTVQNWYPGDKNGIGGVYNLVTKRGLAKGKNSKISWTQVETGSSITWKYPSCILQGEASVGEFFSLALTKNYQQADTGTKMIHIGKNTRSKIISKSICSGNSRNTYRGLVHFGSNSGMAKNYTQCDSLLIKNSQADKPITNTLPVIESGNSQAKVEHEATTSKVSQQVLDYLQSRGLNLEQSLSLYISGFSQEILQNLPMEFAIEARNLLSLKLEGTIA